MGESPWKFESSRPHQTLKSRITSYNVCYTKLLRVLFEGDLKAEAALDAIAEAGYAVRHLPGQGLPQALRITIGKREDMDAIVATLRKLVGESA